MCKHTVKKLPYLLRYVPDHYNNWQMCDKAVKVCFWLQEMCNKAKICSWLQEMCNKAAADDYPHALEFVPERYRTQKMWEAVSVPDQYKTQEMCDRFVSEDPFLIVYCADKYKTQRICDKTVEDSLAALKLIPDWFVTNQMIKELFISSYTHENMF